MKLDNLLGKYIRALWLHQGGVSSKFDSLYKKDLIISQSCALGTPLQNGVMERKY